MSCAHVRHASAVQAPLPGSQAGHVTRSSVCTPCPTSQLIPLWAGQTEQTHFVASNIVSEHSWRTGTRTAPSRAHQPQPWIPGRWRNKSMRMTAWDKSQRLGEATNPGPEPPRELYLQRKNGQRDPIRLCTQNGGWFGMCTLSPHSEWPRDPPPVV